MFISMYYLFVLNKKGLYLKGNFNHLLFDIWFFLLILVFVFGNLYFCGAVANIYYYFLNFIFLVFFFYYKKMFCTFFSVFRAYILIISRSFFGVIFSYLKLCKRYLILTISENGVFWGNFLYIIKKIVFFFGVLIIGI